MTTPEIPYEAVEAAAEALEARAENDDWEWCLGDARAALSAAAPLLQAQALRYAANAMDADPEFRDPLRLKSDWLRARAAELEGNKP